MVRRRTYTVDAPHFNAGFVALEVPSRPDEWIVTGSAPILRYMRGWSVTKVEAYCANKGWTCTHNPAPTITEQPP